jgi:hypothetical protein
VPSSPLASHHRISGQNDLQGKTLADQTRESLRATGPRNDTQLDFRLTKPGGFRGQSDGASQCGFAAASQGKAIDCRDHRLAEILDEIKGFLSVPGKLFRLNCCDTGKLADVRPRDKCLVARSCQDAPPYLGIISSVLESYSQLGKRFLIKCVENLGTIERHVRDRAFFSYNTFSSFNESSDMLTSMLLSEGGSNRGFLYKLAGSSTYAMPAKFPWATSRVFMFDPSRFAL